MIVALMLLISVPIRYHLEIITTMWLMWGTRNFFGIQSINMLSIWIMIDCNKRSNCIWTTFSTLCCHPVPQWSWCWGLHFLCSSTLLGRYWQQKHWRDLVWDTCFWSKLFVQLPVGACFQSVGIRTECVIVSRKLDGGCYLEWLSAFCWHRRSGILL